jgi:malate synthase
VRYAAYEKAANLMRDLILAPQFTEFLTLPAYERVLKDEKLAAA